MDSDRNSFRPGDRESRGSGRIPPVVSKHSSEFSPIVLVGMGVLMLIVLGVGMLLLFRVA